MKKIFYIELSYSQIRKRFSLIDHYVTDTEYGIYTYTNNIN